MLLGNKVCAPPDKYGKVCHKHLKDVLSTETEPAGLQRNLNWVPSLTSPIHSVIPLEFDGCLMLNSCFFHADEIYITIWKTNLQNNHQSFVLSLIVYL